ncbi:MAG: long-chain fatty acid--CoA ligase [Alphaproteobacteria bacterium]|nr:MAG: long-chain fatty acid--CoA ligase [Alphaproteobacteria bacterium]
MTPIAMFARACRRWSDAVAAEAEGTSLTYRQLHERVVHAASALQQIDPEPGSRVGLCSYNSLEHLIAFLAIFAAGKVWVPLYPRLGGSEITAMADFVEASIVITQEESRPLFEELDTRIITLEGEGADTFRSLEHRGAGKRPRDFLRGRDDLHAIKFTGGTTGLPKGVMQPVRAWNANIATQIITWGMGAGERTLCAAPMTHGAGTYLMPTLASGGTLVIVDRQSPEELIATLAQENITTVFLPPTLIQLMAGLAAGGELSFPRLRNLIYGAGPMQPKAIAQAQEVFGPCIATTYGQTEAPQIATALSAQELMREELRSSVGRETLLTRVAVMDEDGRLLPEGEIGEVVIRGDLVMTGYWRQPDKSAETLVDGWLHTGDLGMFDETGCLYLKGRSKDVIISGGFNIYPGDVEAVLVQHPAVADCAVFGVPDEKWGEAVHAAVELRHEADAASLIAHMKAVLGSVKAPKQVHIYDALPRNAYGKLQRQELVTAVTGLGKGKR